jgi:hypothetical protein
MSDVRVVVLGSDPEILRRLARPGVRLVARRSPREAVAYAARVRPELVVLGPEHARSRWAPLFARVSPETLVFSAEEGIEAA